MHLVLYCKNLISALNDSWNDKGVIRELQQDLLVICNNSTRSDHNKGMKFISNTVTPAEVQSWSQVLTGGALKQSVFCLIVPHPLLPYAAAPSLPSSCTYHHSKTLKGEEDIYHFFFLPRGRAISFLCY